MTIQITICTDNAAFQDRHLVDETIAVLDQCKDQFNGNGMALGDLYTLRDTNGNQCGTIEVKR